jgi:ELWxxDGT repeat protein
MKNDQARKQRSCKQHRLRLDPLEPRLALAVGAAMLVDLNPGLADSDPSPLVDVNGTAYFTATTAEFGKELWKTDGTAGGTVRVTDIANPDERYAPRDLSTAGGILYFIADRGLSRVEGDTTTQLRSGGGKNFTDLDGTLYFTATGTETVFIDDHGGSVDVPVVELWKGDGTQAGTVKVRDLAHSRVFGPYGEFVIPATAPDTMVASNHRLFMRLSTDDGYYLVNTDGTAEGTLFTKSFNIGDDSGRIYNLINANDTLLFGVSGTTVDGLWKSKGEDNTQGPLSTETGDIANLTGVGSLSYFSANGGVWKTNGFAGGTVRVTDVSAPLEFLLGPFSEGSGFFNVNGTLYFQADDGVHGMEPWISDGTAAGTRMVADIHPGPEGSGFSQVIDYNGRAYFVADNGTDGREMWSTDGTAAGTMRVSDIRDGDVWAGSFANIGGVLYFSGEDTHHGHELWRVTDQAAPRLGLGGSVWYRENAAAVVLAPNAVVSDADSANFENGYLQVAITVNAHANDRLRIQNVGTGPGQIGVTDSQVTYGGVTIGKRTGGVGTTPAVVEFNQNATPAAVQALVRALTFITLGDAPSPLTRTLTLKLSDGDGGISGVATKLVNVVAVNDAPVLDNSLNPTLPTIAEDTKFPAGTPVWKLLSGAVQDVDADAKRGLAVTAASTFNGNWQFKLSDGSWRATGNISSESPALLLPSDAQVRFIPKQDFQGTVKLYYRAWDQTQGSAGNTLTTVDNTGGVKSMSTAFESTAVTITPINDAPRLGLYVESAGYQTGSAPITLAPAATVSDVDSPNFANGRLLVTTDTARTTGANVISIGGPFTVSDGGVFLGNTEIGRGGGRSGTGIDLIVVFNQNATPDIVQQLLRALKFKSTAPIGEHSVAISVSDGDGGRSNIEVMTVDVT